MNSQFFAFLGLFAAQAGKQLSQLRAMPAHSLLIRPFVRLLACRQPIKRVTAAIVQRHAPTEELFQGGAVLARICSSTPGAILQPQPPPCESWVRRGVAALAAFVLAGDAPVADSELLIFVFMIEKSILVYGTRRKPRANPANDSIRGKKSRAILRRNPLFR